MPKFVWETFLSTVVRPNVVDPGWPVFAPSTVLGQPVESTQLGGYSIVEVADRDAALAIAKQAPPIERGGGVEVGELAELPPEHPAERMRQACTSDSTLRQCSRWRTRLADLPVPTEGILLTHFVLSSDVARSRRFYSEVLGGEVVLDGEPAIIALANALITINVGGPPTKDKPNVFLEPPR
jgi:hypothetical protein